MGSVFLLLITLPVVARSESSAELDTEKGIGLIERKKQGQGKPAMIYIKNFVCRSDEGNRKSRLSEIEKQDFGKPKVKTFENPDSRLSKIESADFGKKIMRM